MTIEIPRDRVFGLDALRALAIFLVVYSHGAYVLAALLPMPLVQLPLLDGVSIFFVLSGYLIGGILIRNFERGPVKAGLVWNFWLRRWLRTLPNYFLILSLLLIYQVTIRDSGAAELWSYFLFIQNFAGIHPAFFPEAWSLSVEEWFYILLPLFLLAIVLIGVRVRFALLGLIVATLLVSVLYRYGRVVSLEFKVSDMANLVMWDELFRKQVITRLDSLMYGVLAAYLHYYKRDWWLRHRKTLLFVGLAVLLFHKTMSYYMVESMVEYAVYYSVFSFVDLSIGTMLLLPWLSEYKIKSGLAYELVTRLSLISYSVYLVHFSLVRNILVPAILSLSTSLEGSSLHILSYVLYWLLTIVLSVLLYKFFELPMMNLRGRLPLTRTAD